MATIPEPGNHCARFDALSAQRRFGDHSSPAPGLGCTPCRLLRRPLHAQATAQGWPGAEFLLAPRERSLRNTHAACSVSRLLQLSSRRGLGPPLARRLGQDRRSIQAGSVPYKREGSSRLSRAWEYERTREDRPVADRKRSEVPALKLRLDQRSGPPLPMPTPAA